MFTTKSAQQIVAEIRAYMAKFGKPYSAWYVGIACDPRRRLFIDHNVDQQNGPWIHDNAGSDTAARAIENHFHSQGCKGGPCGGDYTTTCAYAYLITPSTRE